MPIIIVRVSIMQPRNMTLPFNAVFFSHPFMPRHIRSITTHVQSCAFERSLKFFSNLIKIYLSRIQIKSNTAIYFAGTSAADTIKYSVLRKGIFFAIKPSRFRRVLPSTNIVY